MKTSKLPKAGLLLAACSGVLATAANATDKYPYWYQLNRDMWNAPLQAATDVAIYAPMYSSLNFAFVADAATTTITRYLLDRTGDRVGANGTPFTFPTFGPVIEAIAVNDIPGSPNQGQVYVAEGNADGSGTLINVFDLTGKLLLCGAGPFTKVTGLAVDRDGELYVADQTSKRTLKFDESEFYARDVCVVMTPVTTYQEWNTAVSPLDVTVSNCEKLVFRPDSCGCLMGNNNDGSKLWSNGIPFFPGTVALDAHDPNEQVWVSNPASTKLQRYTFVNCEPMSVRILEAETDDNGAGKLTAAGHMEFRRFFQFPSINGRSTCHERLFVCDGKRVAVFAQDHTSNAHPAGMVAWWKFNDMAGGSALDQINGNDGTFPFTDRPEQVEGLVDGGFAFTDADDGVEVPDSSTLNLGTDDFTIECWLKTCDEAGVADLLDKREMSGGAAVAGYSLFLYNGTLSLQLAAGNTWFNWVSTSDVADCQYHHCAAVVSRAKGKLTLFVDGEPTNIEKAALPTWLDASVSIDNTSPLLMGRHPVASPTSDFEGCLDEVTIYKKALSPAAIHQLYQLGCAGKAP